MFWTASAIAMPPMPSPVTSAVTLIPRLSRTMSRTIDQSTTRTAMAMTLIVIRVPASAARCSAIRSDQNSTSPPAHVPAWKSTTTITTRCQMCSWCGFRMSASEPAHSATMKMK